MINEAVIQQLEFYYKKYNNINFIKDDPISIPHQFSKKQDIEIAGFFAAILAWGLRKTIIKNARQIMHLMDDAPHDFILNHQPADLKKMEHFVHRTFNSTDLLYCIHFFQHHYKQHDTLEILFAKKDMEQGLINFQQSFCSLPDFPGRTKKHISSPLTQSTCKRLNMYLRWMVRKDENGVDFGIWNAIAPRQLYIPFDVHVEKIARRLNLISRPQRDWKTVVELTGILKQIDAQDPVRFDFALFGMGVDEKG
jgi:uncharacterized protein (TIGR02757 family)